MTDAKAYSQESLDYIRDHASTINNISALAGMNSSVVMAGAIREMNRHGLSPTINSLEEWWLNKDLETMSHAELKSIYDYYKIRFDKDPSALADYSALKLDGFLFIDAGPGSIRVYTAIRLIEK